MLRQIKKVRTTLKARRKFGPADAGRKLTYEEYDGGQYTEGFVYEIIDGALVVTPVPAPDHYDWIDIIGDEFKAYIRRRPDVVNFVATHSEVYIPSRVGPTRPQPDIAVFRNYPRPRPKRWDDICPMIVVEVVSPRRSKKDTQRNRDLYWLASGIMEYWIVVPDPTLERPRLLALVRHAGATDWEEHVVPYGKSYRSSALPGFAVNLGERS